MDILNFRFKKIKKEYSIKMFEYLQMDLKIHFGNP